MPYTRQNWQNGPLGGTPISAERLNYIEAGIEAAASPTAFDNRYVLRPNVPTNAVFVGTSNVAAPATWAETLCTRMGWTVRNFAVAGMGYTIGGATNNFDAQLRRAAADASFANADVGFVFIADGANDARANASVTTAANALYAYAKTTFPNARIIVVPAFWTNSYVDLESENRAHLMRVVYQLKDAATQNGVEYVDGTWTWTLDDSSLILPGEVHYTAAGYLRIADWMGQYFRGSNTWADIGWQDVTFTSPYAAPTAGTPKIRAMRNRHIVTVAGEFRAPSGIANASYPFTLPYGLRPARMVPVFYAQAGSTAPKFGQIGTDGRFQVFGADTNTNNVNFNTQFSVF